MSELTYRDVQVVLALLDGWPDGRVCYRDAELAVEADCARADDREPPLPVRIVRSPAVGVFRAAAAGCGAPDGGDVLIGRIRTPTREVPVVVEASPAPRGTMTLLVDDGDFVEYAQPLAKIVSDA